LSIIPYLPPLIPNTHSLFLPFFLPLPGVNHLLVEKNKGVAPWSPAQLFDVSDAAVDAYFAPLAPELELQLDEPQVSDSCNSASYVLLPSVS
jgi:hypothetical protein